ncbi:TPA: hypothetical protein EYP66_17400 [Candidatus Poribacteria bacterium]|nr:hypothetical protein [Candidatus Poribacteria bacterium]
MKAIFTVLRSRPFVQIKPAKNVDKVYVKRDVNLAILPDRFADDSIEERYNLFSPDDKQPEIFHPFFTSFIRIPASAAQTSF